MKELGIVLDFKSKIITIDEITLPMRNINLLQGSSSTNSAIFASFLLFLYSLIHLYSERQLGLFDGLILGLRLGTSEGLRPGMSFGFLDRLVLGLRLGTKDAFRLSD